jgi:nitrate/nitrite-specific signal transduction histidine kinase
MKRNRWRGLRSKIIAWSFVPTAIILSAVAWFTFYSYQEVLGDLTMKQDWAVVHARADQAHEALAGLINSRIRSIGLEIDIDPSLAPEVRARNILERAPGIEIFDGGIYFVDLDGRVFKTHPEQPELMGEDWSETPQFRFARDHPPGSAPLTDLRTIGTKESGIVCVIWPMHNQEGEFVGAGYYCLSIEPTGHNVLYELLNGLSLGRNMYIVDGNQRIVFSPDPAQSGKDLSGEASVQQLLQSQTMSTRFQRGTEDMLISYDPFATVIDERNSWLFISEQSWSEVMQPTLPYRQLLLVLLALGVAVPVLVTAYGVRHITDPIQKLIRASEQVTAGQFGHRIEVRTADEIETLADQFNLMSARLDDSYSLLEKKVADRTRELAILNSIISVASHSLEVSEILGDALNKTVEQMGFEAGAAFQLGPDGRKPHLAIHRGFEPTAALDLAGTELIAGHVDAADRQASVTTFEVGDLQEEGLRSQIDRAGVRRLFRVPLRTKTRTLGFFLLGRHSLSPCSSEELSLLTSIGAQVGVAMENAHLYEQAEKTATTAERSRLARELHDAVTQTLFSANLIGDVLPQIWERNPEEGMRSLEELRQLTRGALAEMRTMLLEMRPESLERSDLRALLTQLADAFVGRVRVPIALVIQGDGELSHEVKVVFYRVAQEALNNIARHSGARQVSLHLEGRPDRLQMSIKDDGLGFEPDTISPDHLGIAIMRERANSIGACLKMETRLGQGTRVELDWRPPRKEGVDEHA